MLAQLKGPTDGTVELLLRKLSQGSTEKSLLEAYPHLTPEDIKAAIAYAGTAKPTSDPRR